MMSWLLGVLALVLAASALRLVLGIGTSPAGRRSGLLRLPPEREAVYQPVAQAVETHAAILGISLNDAFEERDAGRDDIAWRLVQLAVGEWGRTTELLEGLLGTVAKNLSQTPVVVAMRSVATQRFKSRTMTDFFRMYELLDQLVFRSRLRFQLQLRVLRRAAATLTTELRRNYRYVERTGDRPPELWERLDLLFHDFDLVGKETLLAFRIFLACLPDSALAGFTRELDLALRARIRSIGVPANH